LAAQLQTRIERIPSGLRRIIIAIVVLAILAFLFPLSDSDRHREPNGTELLIPTLAETATPDALAPQPDITTPSTTVTITRQPSELSQPQPNATSSVDTSPAATTTAAAPATRSVMTPSATRINSATPTVRSTNTPVVVCTPSPRAGWEFYTVRRGDTLQGIANLVGASIEELTEANCLDNPDHITAGQQLWAPALPDPFATPSRTPRPVATPTSAG